MKKSDWMEKIRKHLSVASVGNSTLMKQSGEGRVTNAQQYLIRNMKLNGLSKLNETNFKKFLNRKTVHLSKKLLKPNSNQPNWGAARKVLNIYLRLCAMNKDLNSYFKLYKIESFLEVPLDNHIIEQIDNDGNTNYSKDFKIKSLTKEDNFEIQNTAQNIANKQNLFRYELDILYWNFEKVNA